MFPIRDHNPSARTPWVTYGLMVLNIGVFLATLGLEQNEWALAQFYYDYALIPAISSPQTYVTSQFLHGGFMHIAGNMLFLYIFGDNIEDEMGHMPFLGFYLAGGIAAGLAQTLSEPASTIPMVGASGAIAAVMGGYMLLYPKARVDVLVILIVFFRIFPVPAWIVLGIWFALQFYAGTGTAAGQGGVAYWAHSGGFIAGLALTLPLWLRRGGPRYWTRTDGHPPHPVAEYRHRHSRIPVVRRRR